jgi:hypothetical protein
LTSWDGARAQIPIAGPIQIQIPSLVAEDIAGRFFALTPVGVTAKIPAPDACSEIDPEPVSTREAGAWIVPAAVAAVRFHVRSELRQDRGTTMSDDPRHRSRRRRQFQVELLEGRALLSASSVSSPKTSLVISEIQEEPLESRALRSASSVFSPNTSLAISESSEYVNQQEGAFTVTLTLVKPHGAGRFTPSALNAPVTIELSAALAAPSGGASTAASPIFAPFNASVTFPAGASTETVSVPVISSLATYVPVTISLTAASTPSSLAAESSMLLYSSPDAVPPTITSVQPVTEGKLASAIVLGFNKPMVPSTVENIHNYRILSPPMTTDHSGGFTFSFSDGPGTYESTTTQYQSFPIAAATYDPSTSTVTLKLKRPVKASSLYEISGAYPARGHALIDLAGQQLTNLAEYPPIFTRRVAAFTFAVHPALGMYPSPVGALKSTMGGTQNWLSG